MLSEEKASHDGWLAFQTAISSSRVANSAPGAHGCFTSSKCLMYLDYVSGYALRNTRSNLPKDSLPDVNDADIVCRHAHVVARSFRDVLWGNDIKNHPRPKALGNGGNL